AVVTRSEQGCCIVSRDGTRHVVAFPIKRLVDATGAGDLFAAGFLFGLTRGVDLSTAARLGALAAAEVIQHVGARPETSLEVLAHLGGGEGAEDRKSTRLNSSHRTISYAVFCLKKKKKKQ